MSERVWRWDFARHTLVRETSLPSLKVADSWLVVDGAVRAWERHQTRFAAAARTHGTAVPTAFWTAVATATPRWGQWFPRVEAAETGQVGFRLRPAPPRATTVAVWVPPFSDPRVYPHWKGPDLPLLAQLREMAQREHCDDALLLTNDRAIIEAAHANIVWWNGDALCLPAPPAFAGITTGLLVEEAQRRGIPVHRQRAAAATLASHETWLVNALHGIRRVTRWGSHPAALQHDDRYREWQQWLTAQRVPLPGLS